MYIKKLILFLLGILSINSLAVQSDDPHTPVKRKKRTFDKINSPFVPGTPPSTAKKRQTVHRSTINKITVESWPTLYESHEWDINFLQELAVKKRTDGKTLLHIALEQEKPVIPQNINCINALLEAGAQLTTHSNDSSLPTPLHLWVAKNKSSIQEIANVLRQHPLTDMDKTNLGNDYETTPLHLACSQGMVNFEKFITLVEMGHPLNVRNTQGQTILHRLAQAGPANGKNEILAYLQTRDLSSLINQQDYIMKTALHWAIQNGDLRMFEFLMRQPHINTNAVDAEYTTALDYALANVGKRGKNGASMRDQLERHGAKTGDQMWERELAED